MDYFLFSQMLLNGGQFGSVRILGKKTVELMTSNHPPSHIPDMSYKAIFDNRHES